MNGQEILKEERKGAEIDYLKRFGASWLTLKSEEEKNNFNKAHPSYQMLVASKYIHLVFFISECCFVFGYFDD